MVERNWSVESRAAAAERMRRNMANPAYKVKALAAAKAQFQELLRDPAFRSNWLSAQRRARGMPDLSPEQTKLYRKLRKIVGRDAALAEALKP